MIEIIAFRHGETDWNQKLKFQGHTDIPLNSVGKDQAKSLIYKLDQFQPEVIICSDLVRARETAHIANSNLQAPVEFFRELRECHLGDAEGLHRDEVFKKFGAEVVSKWNSIQTHDLEFSFPNGESKLQNLKNITLCIEQFVTRNPHYKKIAVSSHGGTLRRLVHHCQHSPKEPVAIPNCVAFRIDYIASEGAWIFRGTVES
jgi:broad specificity phosphatase PhoE